MPRVPPLDPRAHELRAERASIRSRELELDAPALPVRQRAPLEMPAVLMPGSDEPRELPPDQARSRNLQQGRGSEVGLDDRPIGIQCEKSDRRRVVEPAVSLPRFVRRMLALPQLLVLDLQLDLVDL